jgi:hypothetical protein
VELRVRRPRRRRSSSSRARARPTSRCRPRAPPGAGRSEAPCLRPPPSPPRRAAGRLATRSRHAPGHGALLPPRARRRSASAVTVARTISAPGVPRERFLPQAPAVEEEARAGSALAVEEVHGGGGSRRQGNFTGGWSRASCSHYPARGSRSARIAALDTAFGQTLEKIGRAR